MATVRVLATKKNDTVTMTTEDRDTHNIAVLSAEMKAYCGVVDLTSKDTLPRTTPIINDLTILSQKLPDICNSIYKILGSQQREGCYQRCLALDLEEAGLSVDSEVEIPLVYKDRIVGSRRADLVATTLSKEKAVLELKAVRALSPLHARQLQYYMQHLDVNHGYLINFPHDDGFPSITESVFQLTSLSENVKDTAALNATTLQLRHDPNREEDPQQVQVVQFQRFALDSKEGREELERRKLPSTMVKPKWGVTTTGLSCKICEEEKGYCRYQADQKSTDSSDTPHGCSVS
jgi:GxxExxY protein